MDDDDDDGLADSGHSGAGFLRSWLILVGDVRERARGNEGSKERPGCGGSMAIMGQTCLVELERYGWDLVKRSLNELGEKSSRDRVSLGCWCWCWLALVVDEGEAGWDQKTDGGVLGLELMLDGVVGRKLVYKYDGPSRWWGESSNGGLTGRTALIGTDADTEE